ncbi:flagellar assembly peptidoglycan hydrolase FlgJ [Pseudomonas sp. B14-6]|jgi:flagellar protein FlgJ|uniref:flagellar assembly peptidoglycan hydrolase FlgJ n=1 Tax=Pseudomonas sp. B14-6 TaxID=2738843 RepID=UPI00155F0140|nr:flagellar assembly peptidoglycan hydrolase FlgJ [Pseudomonas sp. B14-6]MBU0520697.1 flagellar assembly peptidoglycan hydrolase FlgJ [Gammaproteobacteria bacterium]MBU0820989.1 flagellar assembly peptidoglycan hydrolase FlgJ [Gammaproteobacteria bacterium]MBU0841871.1 flagellar assembly peptidoglycan hydrolase FlgJ [Gammaproteobacteria bacterium]MBU1843505.1 flagellar assembly peptidoglycan hydrolase FlgJ [Gammaproteobacteria bacterium]QKG66276.1 flagellar assembly peptidoglycan hydrolase Fl
MDMRKGGLGVSSNDSGSYSDLNRLNQLKVGDKDSDANMRKVAQEFESLFLGEMLKSMRSATDALGKDNPLNTPAAKQYQEMYDQQLAVSMSREGGGIGLADVLMRQMSKNKPLAPGEAAAASAAKQEAAKAAVPTPVAAGTAASDGPLSRLNGQRPLWASRSVKAPTGEGTHHNDMALINQRRLALPPKLADRLLAGLVPSATTAATTPNKALLPERAATPVVTGAGPLFNGDWLPSPTDNKSSGRLQVYGRAMAQIPLAPPKKAFSSADEFVNTMLPMAKEAADRIGVDPRYLVAQAALETGWGKSVMRAQDGSSSHNLFGIKASSSWKGESARAITSEFRNGEMVKETAEFRSYDSYKDSFHDLVTLLQTNNRYQDVLKSADNPEQFVRELQKAGYATDPAYASKISQIAKQMTSYQNYAAAGASTTPL